MNSVLRNYHEGFFYFSFFTNCSTLEGPDSDVKWGEKLGEAEGYDFRLWKGHLQTLTTNSFCAYMSFTCQYWWYIARPLKITNAQCFTSISRMYSSVP